MSRIAIVDDSRLVRAFAAGALRAKGHETVEVEPTSLFEVLQVLRESPVDLLLVDFLMPECPGESLVRAVREDAALRDLPILVVSAHRDDALLQTMQQLGISGFLLKPVDAATLVAKVAEAIEA
ncbi:response regulator [Geothrix sp. PMB-07]|uniref:response regulator n=1 Tax=Geothrix sp. PMB-07 TaxID=3068640 RepID=UPI002741D236|nr:response regulator [Geothrix sp. PMB-07]WLT30397.1 response regulator [Geothrix sp. PMB-07]